MGGKKFILNRSGACFFLKPTGAYLFRLFLIVTIVITVISIPVFAEEAEPGHHFGLGPFQIRSQSPAHSLRLSLLPTVPGNIIPGHFQARIGGTWTNVWAEEERYLLDYEMFDTDLALGYGISPRFFISMGYDRRDYFGGAMDGFIQGFHDILNLDQTGRSEYPRNQTRIVFYDEAENVLLDTDDVGRLQNAGISVSAQYIFHHGTDQWPAVGLSGTLRYGVEKPDGGDDGEPIDIGVSLGISKRWSDRWYTYFSGGFTYYGQSEYLGLQLNDTILSAMLALEWRWRPNFSILFQYLAIQGAAEDFGQLSDPSQEVTFGLKWQPSNMGVIEFGIIENIFIHDNTPDLGVHLAYTHQF